jgi:EmrB/QacA subfamily drug resistance transporter
MTSPSTSTDANTRWDARLWGLLIVLCSVLFLDGLDVSMVGVALPSIRDSLDLSASSLQWVVSGYVLGYGGLLLLGGRAADLLGRRTVFLIALGVFAGASLLGGLVSDPGLLIGARFIKGASAAFTAPAGLSIITTTFAEGPVRNRALAFYTACGASGFSMGLVLSGLLTEVGWRWTFLLPAPIAVAALLAAIRYVPRTARPDRAGQRYDVTGAVTATASMLLFVYAVVEAPQAGWASAQTLLSFLVAAALLATFVVVESRVEQPLVRLGIFRSPALIRANLGAVILIGSYFGFQFLVTQYLQTLLGWSALETGLGFLPAGVMVALGATRLGPIVDRYGTARLLAIGFGSLTLGYALFLRVGESSQYAAVVFPTIMLIGVGFALCYPSLNIQATAGVADHEQGLASGLINTSFQVGGALVLAVVTALMTSHGGNTAHTAHDLLASYRPGLIVSTGVAAVGFAIALYELASRRRERDADAVLVRAGEPEFETV